MTTVTPRPKAKKKTARKNYSAQCDKYFAEWVRSVGMCESGRLNHAGNLQCCHGFSRRYRATRWDRRQCWAMCQGCHTFYTHHPLEWDEWMRRQLGAPLYAEIRDTALHGHVPSSVELKELAAELKQKAGA